MKHSVAFRFIILMTGIACMFNSCKKSGDDPAIWPDEQKTFVSQMLAFQDQAGQNFNNWAKSMDSLSAVKKLLQYFQSDPNVSFAKVTSQGISVEYTNGTRGGIILNTNGTRSGIMPNSGQAPGKVQEMSKSDIRADYGPPYAKSVVNNKKMILFDAAYSEVKFGKAFKDETDRVIASHRLNLPKIKYTLDKVYTDEQATLERYTQLSGYGIIDLASHGYDWQDSTGIVDVHMLTGETASPSMKYLDDITNHSIIIMQYMGKNRYCISEKFISGHNNFSKDTVLMIGSFCYSFRGKWPNLQKSFADGAYVGYTRRIDIDKCADYDINLIFNMSDTTKSPLMNIKDWMNDPKYPKYYQSASDAYPVHVEFAGDSTLTLLPDTTTTVKDIDGNIYHIKKIGNQKWSMENLKTTRLNDGKALAYVTDNASWSNISTGAYCFYKNDATYKTDYGALYNWHAVSTGKLAPKGCHIPTLDEWNTMINFLGGNAIAGGKLKETGISHWRSPNTGATNSSGFKALPGGYRYIDGQFINLGFAGAYWTSSQWNQGLAHAIYIRNNLEITENPQFEKQYGGTLRFVKD